MCGRTTITIQKKVLEQHYHAQMSGEFTPNYNAAPTQELPIVRNVRAEQIERARWGFLPHWMVETKPQGVINARSETVFEKPMFAKAAKERRCLVPADGFFEWRRNKQERQPYYFRLKKQELFSLAGIWEEWQDEKGEPVLTYALLTTEANSLMQKIHDRMPVLLNKKGEQAWLDPDLPPEQLQQLFRPFSARMMEAYPVSKLVNSAKNNRPEILRPLEVPEADVLR